MNLAPHSRPSLALYMLSRRVTACHGLSWPNAPCVYSTRFAWVGYMTTLLLLLRLVEPNTNGLYSSLAKLYKWCTTKIYVKYAQCKYAHLRLQFSIDVLNKSFKIFNS
jgi:hypothetical protein